MTHSSYAPLVPLKFVGRIASGGTPKASHENWDGDIPFITPPDLNGLDGAAIEEWGRSITEPGAAESTVTTNAVLLSCRAPIGHVGVASQTVAFNQGCKAIVPRDPHDLGYLAYCLVSSRTALQAAGRGTTFMEISTTELSGFAVPWPSPTRRRTIAAYLDRETSEIDEMLAKMDELRKSLEMRREHAVARVLLPHFDGPTVPLAFASGPANFFDGDWVESKDQDPNGEIRLLQLADIGAANFLDKSNRRVNQEAFDRLSCRELFPGDVLIARMPDPIGRACVLPQGLGRTITVVDVAVVRADQQKLLPQYLTYVLNSRTFRSLTESLQGGSTRQRISRSRLGQQRIPSVSIEVQQDAIAHLDEITGRIDTMLHKVAELKALLIERRAGLITDVVTGRREAA